MAHDSDHIREQFIDQVGEFAASLGLNRSVGQLYALLYMSPSPLSLDEMAEACDMSKGNASINLRELERWGAVRRVYVRGDRKDYYEPHRDVPQIVISRLREGLGRRLAALDETLEEAERQVEQMGNDAERKKFYRERLKEVRKLRRSLGRVLDNMDNIYKLARRFF
jgi:DNA-binding transcriptional regulator GbsR (MarR family)